MGLNTGGVTADGNIVTASTAAAMGAGENTGAKYTPDGILLSREALGAVKTVDLRSAARLIPNIAMSKNDIKLARKDVLVDKILSAYGIID
jgi:uncharacterized spore protein YtfJ